jgi:hypothetical protein
MIAEFAALGFTALVAHNLADHVLGQTDKQAANKAKEGRVGWSHVLQHVASYHVVLLIMWLLAIAAFDIQVTLLGMVAALLFSAVSHALLDRRWPVRWILERTGSPNFAKMTTPVWGIYASDQALHEFCLWISVFLLVLL